MKTLLSCMLFGALSLPAITYAQDASSYPDKPIRIVVPFAPGGASDVITRKIADKLSSRLKQSVIVDNKPGGNTIIATEYVARAAPDGYTIYSTNTTIVQIPMLYSTARYDEARDFTPILQCCSAPLVLVVRADNPAKSVKELIEHVRSRPGQTSYGTAGAGGTQHLFSETLKRASNMDSVHVPYKGEAPLLSDFLGGRIDWYIATPITILPHIRSGKVRGLAVTGEERLAVMPDTATFKELGVPGLGVIGWYGMFAPAKTPKAVIDKLSKELVAIMQQPDITAYIKENGLIPTGLGADEFAKKLPFFREAYQKMIKENNIRID